jgi:hypothetical protein
MQDSNPRPSVYKTAALPAELIRHANKINALAIPLGSRVTIGARMGHKQLGLSLISRDGCHGERRAATRQIHEIVHPFSDAVPGGADIRPTDAISTLRSSAMQGARMDDSRFLFRPDQIGLWKVGDDRVGEMQAEKTTARSEPKTAA